MSEKRQKVNNRFGKNFWSHPSKENGSSNEEGDQKSSSNFSCLNVAKQCVQICKISPLLGNSKSLWENFEIFGKILTHS